MVICLLCTIVIIASASSFPLYLTGRIIEGLGAAAIAPSAQAIFFDLLSEKKGARVLALTNACAATVPALTPILGGYILAFDGWRWIFIVFLIASCALLVWFMARLPETSPRADRAREPVRRSLLEVLGSLRFWGFTASFMLLSGSLFGYYAAMPFWYHQQFGFAANHYAFLSNPSSS